MLLENAIEEFTTAKRAAGRSLRTIAKYHDTLLALAQHTDGNLEGVTTGDIRSYLAGRRDAGHKPASLNTYYRVFATFFHWCAVEYGIPNPMERVERPQVPKKLPPYLSDEDISKLLNATSQSHCPLRDHAIVLVLVDTGIRAGELINLKMGDIDLREGEVRVFGKDQEERFVPIDIQATQALTRYLDSRRDHGSNRPIFISQCTGKALTVSGLRQILKRLARQAGVEKRVYTHLFRHTFGQRWLANGGDLESLRLALGHNQLNTTQIYAGLRIEDVKRKHQQLSPANRLFRATQLPLW